MVVLPRDVLCIIFDTYTFELGCSPVALLPICRQWNRVALSMRALWTRIVINIDTGDTINLITEEKEEKPSLLATYIQRAVTPGGNADLLFDIRIVWGEWWDDYFRSLRNKRKSLERPRARITIGSKTRRVGTLTSNFERLALSLPSCERWRSLHLELTFSIPHAIYHAVELPILTGRNGIPLPSLQTLTLKNIATQPGGITFPSLSHLYSNNAQLDDPFTYPGSLRTLECYRTSHRSSFNIPWNDLNQLRELRTNISSDKTYPFRHDALNNLRILYLEGSLYGSKITSRFPFLKTSFDASNPLETVELAFSSINVIREVLVTDHDFHFRNMRIASNRFSSKPSGDEWRWKRGEYSRKTWSVDSLEIEAACLLLDWAKTKGDIEVSAMDAQVDQIFRLAEELDPDEVRRIRELRMVKRDQDPLGGMRMVEHWYGGAPDITSSTAHGSAHGS